MQIVDTVIARPVEECWRVFNSPAALTAWVPGLREALVIEYGDDGLPAEIQFEFGKNLIYSLVYRYEPAAGRAGGPVGGPAGGPAGGTIRWEPRPGEHGAVHGFARFEAEGHGTRFTYALEHDVGRKAAERALDDPRVLVEAFARWMHERPIG